MLLCQYLKTQQFINTLHYHITVTSRLFTHIVSKEKIRKGMSDRKDMRGTNYTYFVSCFLILLLIKSRLGTFSL